MSDRQANDLRVIRARWPASLGMLMLLEGSLLLLQCGCSRSGELEVYAVEGILTVNGEPAANANLAFHPLDQDSNARCPVGRTNTRGQFHLTTCSPCDGAPAGDYVVTIVWPDEPLEVDECECPNPLSHDLLKGFYANPERSEFRVTVRPSTNSTDNSFRFAAWRPRDDDPPR